MPIYTQLTYSMYLHVGWPPERERRAIFFRVHLLRFRSRHIVDRETPTPRSTASQKAISSCIIQPSIARISNSASSSARVNLRGRPKVRFRGGSGEPYRSKLLSQRRIVRTGIKISLLIASGRHPSMRNRTHWAILSGGWVCGRRAWDRGKEWVIISQLKSINRAYIKR